jgi:hypothetical protein
MARGGRSAPCKGHAERELAELQNNRLTFSQLTRILSQKITQSRQNRIPHLSRCMANTIGLVEVLNRWVPIVLGLILDPWSECSPCVSMGTTYWPKARRPPARSRLMYCNHANAYVRDSYPMGIAADILQDPLRSSKGPFGVDDPILGVELLHEVLEARRCPAFLRFLPPDEVLLRVGLTQDVEKLPRKTSPKVLTGKRNVRGVGTSAYPLKRERHQEPGRGGGNEAATVDPRCARP